jgi:hypothetical protein
LLSLFSALAVVFVPSLCCVVVLSLDLPSEGLWVDVVFVPSLCCAVVLSPGEGLWVDVVFCPAGFSAVVVLELVWAKPTPPKARLSPMAIAEIVAFEPMVFLLYVIMAEKSGSGQSLHQIKGNHKMMF